MAVYQKRMIYAFLLAVAGGLTAVALNWMFGVISSVETSKTVLWVVMGLNIIGIIGFVIGITGFLLSVALLSLRAFRSPWGVILAFASVIPHICLIVGIIAHWKTIRLLRANGYHAGILGADLTQFQ